jgi:hypothetical protein
MSYSQSVRSRFYFYGNRPGLRPVARQTLR